MLCHPNALPRDLQIVHSVHLLPWSSTVAGVEQCALAARLLEEQEEKEALQHVHTLLALYVWLMVCITIWF